jgi:ring-1,2-phenylacetyl-CoA epoxidase subunit PaaC
MNILAIKDLLYRLADDDLIMGHRNGEWTSLGPILEEDIAFSSMAQDEVGHAHAWYQLMHEFMGENDPDQIAFNRKVENFRSCHLTESPIGDYAFSLMRHFLYDMAESIRLESLSRSSFKPLAEMAKKLGREEKYHQMHAITWVQQLSQATPESKSRMQEALNQTWFLAYSLFEPTEFESALANEGIQPTEMELEKIWEKACTDILIQNGLTIPENGNRTAHYGGRSGKHTEYLQPLLTEMTEVFAIDPTAKW